MRKQKQLARLMIEYFSALKGVPAEELVKDFPSELQDAEDNLTRLLDARFGKPILPTATQSIAISFHAPKTAALFFDRIWWCPALRDPPPDEIIVYGATDTEVWPAAIGSFFRPPLWDWELVQGTFQEASPISEIWNYAGPGVCAYADALFREHGLKAIPMYESPAALEREYRVGDTEAIVIAVQNLSIVNETALQWEQVMEFRSDPAAVTKLRRMRHWLDREFVGKPIPFVTDALAVRLEDYEWALKKHGIETVLGSLADLLDARFLPAASVATAGLAVAGGEFWAAVGAAGILVGKAAVSVTTKLVDLKDRKRGKYAEIAFIHEMKRLVTSS